LAGFLLSGGGVPVRYDKPALTWEQQADMLLSRGLSADRDLLIQRLKQVNYYRLSGYWFHFRGPGDTFLPDTTFETLWSRYTFDRRLRLLVLDAIERVEISVRTGLVYRLAHAHGPFGYLECSCLPCLEEKEFQSLQKSLHKAYDKSRDLFIGHFRDKYGEEHSMPPLWMLCEIMPFGALLTMFRGVPKKIKHDIGADYGVRDVVMESWLGAVSVVRNICAHHGRLWNREMRFKPMIPRKDERWHRPVEIPNARIFGMLTILRYLLTIIAPQSGWPGRLRSLLEEYPDIPLRQMGFPDGWNRCPIWETDQ